MILLAGGALGGCASLPRNGPTSKEIIRASESPANTLGYQLIELDAQVASLPPARDELGLLTMAAFGNVTPPARSDMVMPGDELTVAIYEVGVALFGGSPGAAQLPGGNAPGMAPTASASTIPVVVREDGMISLPYIGTLKAIGFYPEELAEQIRTRLAPFSQQPQVQVIIADSVGNAAYVSGAVRQSGRIRLTSARERLLDLVALAGGTAIDVNDAELHFTRRGEAATVRLADLRAEDRANIPVLPGDRIEIRRQRKSITAFGATDQVSEIPFEAPRLTLAEAIARSAGPADSRANARGVYLFRLERGADDAVRPVIYHVDMLDPQTYFLAQMMQMQDKDVILYANSPSNMTQKLVAMVNMLFSPALAVGYAVR